VQLGPKSNGLRDIDLDCWEAIALAPYLLPKTEAIFGRASKRQSHWLYYSVLDDETRAKIAFAASKALGGDMLVEFRIGEGDKGAQTLFPGSINHDDENSRPDELVEWDRNGEPALVDSGILKRAVTKIAVGALLVRHYPHQGKRHLAGLALGGFLVRCGWPVDEIKRFAKVVAQVAGDNESDDRATAAHDQVVAYGKGDNT
jgi:hypothetical protein